MNIVQDINEAIGYSGRMLSGSKSYYFDRHPGHVVYFNGNIIIPAKGKIWFGDIDINKDGDKLREVAQKHNTVIYVLREMDGRFENELLSPDNLIKKAVWSTLHEVQN